MKILFKDVVLNINAKENGAKYRNLLIHEEKYNQND